MYIEKKISSIPDYFNYVLKISKKWEKPSGYLWYRGIHNKDYDLLPGQYLKNINVNTEENSLMAEFLINYKQLSDNQFDNEWEIYYLMQHYGMPTRLLDWTKSPLNALFFAFEKDDNIDFSPCVWLMNPEKLNKISTDKEMIFTPYKNSIIEKVDINSYLPKKLKSNDNDIPKLPIAIEPVLSNKRIIAQQGCFTIHGIDRVKIDELFTKKNKKYLIKIIIDIKIKEKEEILNSLRTLGIKEELIYQDLNYLAKRIINEKAWKY